MDNDDDKQPVRPPPAPAFDRKICLDRAEKIGLPLLLVLPLLALSGVFDKRVETVTATASGIELHLDYPARSRFQLNEKLEVQLRNSGPHPVRRLSLNVDREYLKHFSQVQFHPLPARIDADAYTVDFNELAPGETRLLQINLQPKDGGRHPGRVWVHSPGQTTGEVRFSTYIFP